MLFLSFKYVKWTTYASILATFFILDFFLLFASFSNSRWLCNYFMLFQQNVFFVCLFLIEIALRQIYPLT